MKRTKPLIIALALLCALALLAAGCGDDGGGETGGGATETAAGEPLSKQEFIVQADEICATGDAAIDAKGEEFTGRENVLNELVRTVIVPMTRQQVIEIRALTPPEGDEEQITEILDKLDQGLDDLEADPNLLSVPDGPAKILEARALAGEYGFMSCNRGGTDSQSGSEVTLGS